MLTNMASARIIPASLWPCVSASAWQSTEVRIGIQERAQELKEDFWPNPLVSQEANQGHLPGDAAAGNSEGAESRRLWELQPFAIISNTRLLPARVPASPSTQFSGPSQPAA